MPIHPVPTISGDPSSPGGNNSFQIRIPLNVTSRRNHRISFHDPAISIPYRVSSSIEDLQDGQYENQSNLITPVYHDNDDNITEPDNNNYSSHHNNVNRSRDSSRLRFSDDHSLSIIPRTSVNSSSTMVTSSFSFFKYHPEHEFEHGISTSIQQFGLISLMNNSIFQRKQFFLNRIDDNENDEANKACLKRSYADVCLEDSILSSIFGESGNLDNKLITNNKDGSTFLDSSFLKVGLIYTISSLDDIKPTIKFTEIIKEKSKVCGSFELNNISIPFTGEIADFVNNDLRCSNEKKVLVESNIFSNLLRNSLCFDKDLGKFIGRHDKPFYNSQSWKPFYMDKFGYLRQNEIRNTNDRTIINPVKNTKFPNSSIFHKIENMCGNKHSTYKLLSKWFDMPPFNQFINTPSPPTPPNGKRKCSNNPENLLICSDCVDIMKENFIFMKLEVDLETLLHENKNKKDSNIRNDMLYKRRRRLRSRSSLNSNLFGTSDLAPVSSSVTNQARNRAIGSFWVGSRNDIINDNMPVPFTNPGYLRRSRMMDTLRSRPSNSNHSDSLRWLQDFHTRRRGRTERNGQRRNDNVNSTENSQLSSDSDESDDEFRLGLLWNQFNMNEESTNYYSNESRLFRPRYNNFIDDGDNINNNDDHGGGNGDDDEDDDDYFQNDDDDDDDDNYDDDDSLYSDFDELYEVEYSSGRSRRIENLLFERNFAREQQHHRRGFVNAKKLYKNSSGKLKLILFVGINRLSGDLFLVPGNLDVNNWSSEENNGELFEDYETFHKLYEVFMNGSGFDDDLDDQERRLEMYHLNQFRDFLNKDKADEKRKIQKLLFLHLLTNPELLNRLNSKEISDSFKTSIDSGNKNNIHESKKSKKVDSQFSTTCEQNRDYNTPNESMDQMVNYFNEKIGFTYNSKKVLMFKPNGQQKGRIGKGCINKFGSFYSFAYQ